MLKILSISILITLLINSTFAQDDEDDGFTSYILCRQLVDSTCNVYNITPIVIPDQSLRAYGQNPLYKNPNVTRMIFDPPNVINYIPTNAFYIYPKIQHFEANNVSLNHVTREAFSKSCKNLSSILLTNNNFAHLSTGFARKCVNLINVTFTNNEIRTIDENALENLLNLKSFDLSNNSIRCIPPKLFTNSPNITSVNFSFNKITAIDSKTFKGLKNLIYVNLNNNQIKFIPSLNLAVSGSLEFSLSDNPIHAIDPNFIETFFKTEDVGESSSVILAMNSIKDSCIGNDLVIQKTDIENSNSLLAKCYANWTVELAESKVICELPENLESAEIDDVTSDLDELLRKTFRAGKSNEADRRVMETGKNASKTLMKSSSRQSPMKSSALAPKAMKSAGCRTDKACRYYLDYLKRYTCVIENVDSVITSLGGEHSTEAYSDSNVTRVYVTDSFLFRIPPVIFTKFPNLNFLSVANTSMSIITDKTIQQCSNLSFLDLSHNSIIHVSKTAFKKCTKLKTIDLTGNPVDYLGIQFSQNLKTIHLNRKDSLETY